MFPFGKSCEISFQFNGIQEKQISQKDVGVDSELLAAVNLYMSTTEPAATTKPAKSTTTGYKRKSRVREPVQCVKPYGVTGVDGGKGDKKSLHRDTERQRRVVMSSLLNNLYSLLPTEFVKELQEKRDRIRTLKANSTIISPLFEEDNIPCNITIFTRNGSLEIQIIGGGYHLSESIKVLLEQGLDVVSTVSSKINGSFIHNIQCQISDFIDVQKLQQRLYDVINPNNSDSSVYEAGTDYSPIDWMENETQFYSLLNFA
ncbi:hypothetical protein V2J09_001845 [Rumex salicifolius]